MISSAPESILALLFACCFAIQYLRLLFSRRTSRFTLQRHRGSVALRVLYGVVLSAS